MWRGVLMAGAMLAAPVAGCGANDATEPSKPLPRIDVGSGQGTDISALPTVAPPPALKVKARIGVTRTPTPSPIQTPTPDTTTVDPLDPHPPVSATTAPPASTPGETIGPEQGGGGG
jgi:hypothetical protein